MVRFLIDGIYDQVLEPNERELDLVERYALENSEGLRKVYGLKLPTLKKESVVIFLKPIF